MKSWCCTKRTEAAHAASAKRRRFRVHQSAAKRRGRASGENAVKHGVEPSPSGALLRISTRLRGHLAVIKVFNTVPAGQGHKGHGIALANVRDRLKLLHDMEGSFKTALIGDLYQARLEVPMTAAQIRAAQAASSSRHH